MKKIFMFLSLLLASGAVFAQTGQTPFAAGSPSYPFAVTSSAGTAIRITPNAGFNSCIQYVIRNSGTVTAWVAFGTSSSITNTIPAGSSSGNSIPIDAGTTTVLTEFNNAWFNAQTSSSTTTLTVFCGSGAWTGTTAQAGTGGSSASVVTSPVAVTTTDKSSTITAGGVAQTAIASNASRKAWCIQNPPSATETLTVRASGVATSTASAILSPGSQACSLPGTVDTGAISVIATTTSHAYSGWEAQ